MWKRIGVFLFCCALILSIWKDLTIGSPIPTASTAGNEPIQPDRVTQKNNVKKTFQPVLLQVKQGDTLLSITNELNNHELRVTMEQVILDFKELNPEKDPYALHAGSAYYFPHYTR
ncbi:hypothetical protein SAMN05421503_1898 [Terribacillus aidingensis]|uniref:LysM domain-containing protein n=1 Tax=Terribacillus aidingensis TaxID=586416 RepID=A0A285NSR5_9BACI|nr:LysM domain-containing protein [Terribacillus aidingensis]SNZ10896.1 hypothetical protein SAMN05421503_1898 [Terribacillus aidingensis]